MECSNRLSQMPIILGRPFLATARAVKNYEDGTIKFSINGEKFEIDVKNRENKKGKENLECVQDYMSNLEEDDFGDNLCDDELDDIIQEQLFSNPLENMLTSGYMDNSDFSEDDDAHITLDNFEDVSEIYRMEHESGNTHSMTQLLDQFDIDDMISRMVMPMIDSQIDHLITFHDGPSN